MIEKENIDKQNKIHEIIQKVLTEQYGINGCKSIIETLTRESNKTENEILSNYQLFEKISKIIFGKIGESKIIEPVKYEIEKNGIKLKNEKEKRIRILIGEDDKNILKVYREWLQFNKKEVVTSENGEKCLEIYKKEHEYSKENNLENYFDIVILDQIMPKIKGVEVAKQILELNPNQRIIFASGHVENILLDSIKKIGKAVEIIKKPFSIEVLDEMINNKTILEKIEQINHNNESKSKQYCEVLKFLDNFYKK